MRPLFGVVFVPSTPMNDDRLSTSGILQNDLRQRLLPLRHGVKRHGSGASRYAQNHAGVLDREEPFGTMT